MNEIIIDDLFFYYDNVQIFNGTSLHIDGPGFYGITGKSGCGKSTLAKILSNSIVFPPPSTFIVPEKILYCYDKERFPKWMTVEEHFEKVIPHMKFEKLSIFLDAFNVDKKVLESKIFQLSSGQINKVNVIRYLLQDFNVLILDESLNNIDEASKYNIIKIIKYFFNNKILIYITHNLIELLIFSKEIFFMERSKQITEINHRNGLNRDSYSIEDFESLIRNSKELRING